MNIGDFGKVPVLTGHLFHRGQGRLGRAGNAVLLVLIALLFFQGLFSCTQNEQFPPKPPITLPFAIDKAGTKVETEMRVTEYREYIFSLRFNYKAGDKADRDRVKKLVGDDMQDKNGDPGIPTPLKVTITQIEPEGGKRTIVDKEIKELRLRSWGGDNFEKHIDYIKLKPGIYHILVESLQDAPELAGIPIAITIEWYAKNSPIPLD